MKSNEIMKKVCKGSYTGYIIKTIYELSGKPLGWELLKKLKRIPHKITYFLDRSKIKEVRKKTYLDDSEQSAYYLLLTDDTYMEIVY